MIELNDAVVRPVQLSPTDLAGAAPLDRFAAGGDESAFARMLDQQLDRHLDHSAPPDQNGSDRLAVSDAASQGVGHAAPAGAEAPAATAAAASQGIGHAALAGASAPAATAAAALPAASVDATPAATADSGPLAQLIEAIEKLTEGARSLTLSEGGKAAQARAGLEGLLARLREARDLVDLDLGSLLTRLGGSAAATADSAAVGALMQQVRTVLAGAFGPGIDPAAVLSAGDRAQTADGATAASRQRVSAAVGLGTDSAQSSDGPLTRDAQLSRDQQRPRVVVVDLRSQPTDSRGGSSPSQVRAAATATALQPAAGGEGQLSPAALQTADGAMRASPVLDVLALRPQQAAAAETPAPAATEGSRLGDLRSLLPSEVVRHTNILVREGGGEIRLVLRPETLGSVRINVSIENGSLEGRIFVENASVREVIENNLGSLRAALRDEGFEDAALDVSVGDRGAGGQRRDSDPASDQIETGSASTAYHGDAAGDIDGDYRLDGHGAVAVNLVV